MGREIKRVDLDFDWPCNKVWVGYLLPGSLAEKKCPDCKNGYSPHAQHLFDLWYGYVPFTPADNGSTPLGHSSDALVAFAQRNVERAPEFYGTSPFAVSREVNRLADMWNGMWCHHLNQDDVDALTDGGRLTDFTHTFEPDRIPRWQPKEPLYRPTAAEVNEWEIWGFGHDSINASVVIRARCEREGAPVTCATCDGHATTERYPGQRAEAEAWEATPPPAGEGWQMWETVSEGSPVSPVFTSAESLADWLTTEEGGESLLDGPMSYDAALRFVNAGWAPSMVGTGTEIVDGPHWVGREQKEDTDAQG